MEKWQIEREEIAQTIADNFNGYDDKKYKPYDFEWCAYMLQEKGYTKQEWISVKERLPKPYERVFVCTRVGYMNTDMLCENGLWLEHRLFKVTHWMPLPKPPQMKGE